MQAKITYKFSSKLWKSAGHGGWWFVSLPVDMSVEIRENLQWQEEGWGRLKVTARIGKLEWARLFGSIRKQVFICFQ